MTRPFKHFIILVIGLGILFPACSNETDIDTEMPVIEVESPYDEQEFHPGEHIHFDARFSDNVALSQFKISIHYGGDHTHKSTLRDQEEWTYETIDELSGTNQQVQLDVEIPENAGHGEYHFLVYCTDQAGNESWVALNIIIDENGHHDK